MLVNDLQKIEGLISRRSGEHSRLQGEAASTRDSRRKAAAGVRMAEIQKDLARLHERRLSLLLQEVSH